MTSSTTQRHQLDLLPGEPPDVPGDAHARVARAAREDRRPGQGADPPRPQGRRRLAGHPDRVDPRLCQYRHVRLVLGRAALEPAPAPTCPRSRSKWRSRRSSSPSGTRPSSVCRPWRRTSPPIRPCISRTPRGASTRGTLVIPDAYKAGTDEQKARWKVVERGQVVFAENCAYCHSSKQPADGEDRQALNTLKTFLVSGDGEEDDAVRQAREQVQAYFRAAVAQRRLPGEQHAHRRRALPGQRAQGERRPGAGEQRDRGTHLGAVLLAGVQGPARCSPADALQPRHRQVRPHLAAAGGGRGLLPDRVAGEHLGDRPVPAQQLARDLHRRALGQRPDRGFQRRGPQAALADGARGIRSIKRDHHADLFQCPARDPGGRGRSRSSVHSRWSCRQVPGCRSWSCRTRSRSSSNETLRFPVPEGTPINLLANINISDPAKRVKAVIWYVKYAAQTDFAAEVRKLPEIGEEAGEGPRPAGPARRWTSC